MKKKIQFMIPKAKLAFNIEQVLLLSTWMGLDPLALAPLPSMLMLAPKFGLKLKSVQFALAMFRSWKTPAMKSPTKQRSTKETKMAVSRVDLRRKRVTIAHTTARTETMKRTSSYDGVS